VFQAISSGSTILGLTWLGVIAALLVTVGNAGGVGATVAGVSRVPFVVGVDRYLPSWFGKLHPRWRTPHFAILLQAAISAAVLILSQFYETVRGAYQSLVDLAIIIYFVPFLYMYASVIKLSYRRDRTARAGVVLIPGGRIGVWVAGVLGFAVTALSIGLALVPTADVKSALVFELKVVGATLVSILFGLVLYWRGARKKASGSEAVGSTRSLQ
jgi:amino acid transporter